MTKVRDHYGLSNKGVGFLCGCEFEIEDIKSISSVVDNCFIIEDDHSLRNKGKEFKTQPSDYENTLELFDTLHKGLALGPAPFSERTSIHVHVNVRELSIEQLRQLMLVYALFEPMFFDFVGETRQGNIFCVPLSYTYLPSMYKLSPLSLVDSNKWHKYTAFNMLPIRELGTVEFRHMYGTNDREVFNTWLTTLKELYCFIEDNPNFNLVEQLNHTSEEALAEQIVPTLVKALNKPVKHLMQDTVIDVALSVGGLK